MAGTAPSSPPAPSVVVRACRPVWRPIWRRCLRPSRCHWNRSTRFQTTIPPVSSPSRSAVAALAARTPHLVSSRPFQLPLHRDLLPLSPPCLPSRASLDRWHSDRSPRERSFPVFPSPAVAHEVNEKALCQRKDDEETYLFLDARGGGPSCAPLGDPFRDIFFRFETDRRPRNRRSRATHQQTSAFDTNA
jgi:hypothetical protein